MSPRVSRSFAAAIVGVAVMSCGSDGDDGEASAPPAPGANGYVPTSAGQWLLDGSTVQVAEGPNGAAIVHATLPTGNTSDTTITFGPGRIGLASLAPAPGGTPLRDFTLTHALGPQGMTWTMRYVVPVSTVPSDALALSRSPRAPRPLERVIDRAAATFLGEGIAHAADDDGVVVLLQGLLTEIRNEALNRIEQHVSGAEAPLVQIADALMAVSQALERNAEYEKLMQHIEALRACAENPSNPLTQKMYAEDPSSKQRVLDEIDRVQRETRMDLLVRFVGALNAKAAGLGPKWLGFVVGPVTGWADAGIARLTAGRVAQLDQLVTGCGAYAPNTWSGTITFEYDGMVHTATGPTGTKNETNDDTQTVHYEDTITVTAVGVNSAGITASEQAQESYTRHIYHTYQCGSGLTDKQTSDTKSSGTLVEPASAHVSFVASAGTYTFVVSGKSFTASGTTHFVDDNPGGYCLGDDPNIPPKTTDSTQPISWTIPGADLILTGDLDPKNPPPRLTGTKPYQSSSMEGVPVTGTITWTLGRQ